MFFREKKQHIRCNYRFHTNYLSFFQFLNAREHTGTDGAQFDGSVRCSIRHGDTALILPTIFLYFP